MKSVSSMESMDDSQRLLMPVEIVKDRLRKDRLLGCNECCVWPRRRWNRCTVGGLATLAVLIFIVLVALCHWVLAAVGIWAAHESRNMVSGAGCHYSTKDIVNLIPDINRFYLDVFSGNMNFASTTGSHPLEAFSEKFNDVELGDRSESVRFVRNLRRRLVGAIADERTGTLEKFQLGYALSEVDLFLNLTRIGLFQVMYGVVTENGWVSDPSLLAQETAETLISMDSDRKLSHKELQRVLRWLGNYAKKVERMIPFYEDVIAHNKTHANITMVKTWKEFYVPALTFNFTKLCTDVAGMRSPELHGKCLEATSTVNSKNRKLKDWYEQRYLPACARIRPNERPGLFHMPDGAEAYQVMLDYHLGFRKTPDDIHKLGLERVERTKANISEVAGLPFAEVAETLADESNGTLYLCTARPGITRESAIAFYAKCRQDLGAHIDKFFNYFPRGQTYFHISGSGSTFWQQGEFNYATNTWTESAFFNLGVMGRCQVGSDYGEAFEKISALATVAHESFPGHGFQVPLQMEIGCSLSPYVLGAPTGFIEGWALYTETLPFFMNVSETTPYGLYTPPLQRLGFFQNDMLRDNRLVEDTGLHHLGWSYDEARRYMVSNGFNADYADYETYRYITEPGQAVSYMVGRLRIVEMKEFAKSSLGDDYNEPEFHQVLTRFGGSTLDNMLKLLKTYISVKSDPDGKIDHTREFGYELVLSMSSPSNPSIGGARQARNTRRSSKRK